MKQLIWHLNSRSASSLKSSLFFFSYQNKKTTFFPFQWLKVSRSIRLTAAVRDTLGSISERVIPFFPTVTERLQHTDFFFLSLRAFIQQLTSHQWSWVGLSWAVGGVAVEEVWVALGRGGGLSRLLLFSQLSTFRSRVPLSLVPLGELRPTARFPFFFFCHESQLCIESSSFGRSNGGGGGRGGGWHWIWWSEGISLAAKVSSLMHVSLSVLISYGPLLCDSLSLNREREWKGGDNGKVPPYDKR